MDRLGQLRQLAERFGIDLVYAFGSQAAVIQDLVAMGKRPSVAGRVAADGEEIQSDADIGVVFAGGLPPAGLQRADAYALLYNDLSDLVEPLRLDLCFLQENHSVFQAEAIQGYCLYASSPSVRENYEEMICRLAADFRPFLEEYYREALADI